MKKFGLIGIIALIAIMGLAMTACDPLLEDGEIFIDVTPNPALSNARGFMKPADAYSGGTVNTTIGDLLTVSSTGIDLAGYSLVWKMGTMAYSEFNNDESIRPKNGGGYYTVTATKDEYEFVSNQVWVELVPEYFEFLGVWYMNSANQGAAGTLPGNTKYSSTDDKPFWNEKFVVYYNKIVQDDSDIPVNPAMTFNVDDWGKLGAANITSADKTAGFNTGFYLKGGIDKDNSNNNYYKGGPSPSGNQTYIGYQKPFIDLYLTDNKSYLRRSNNYDSVPSGNPLLADPSASITYTFERTKGNW